MSTKCLSRKAVNLDEFADVVALRRDIQARPVPNFKLISCF